MGSSDGGYAAIRYGVTLGADRIMSFDGPTHSAPALDDLAVLTTRLAARHSSEQADLRKFLCGQAYSSRISLWYGEGSSRDKMHALHLSDCNGVTLHPVAGVNAHNVLRWLAHNQDDLLATLRGQIGLTIETRVFDLQKDGAVILRGDLQLPRPYVAPRTDTEQTLAEIWCTALSMDSVGVRDNYSDLGGDSLAAALMFTLIAEAFGIEVPTSTLLSAPTIADLAREIERRHP
jgi:acyl carrier protein